ncbi:MAG: 4Fe-4S dicluster domain-containing protein [Fusobacteriaceae bacterium]
MNIKEIIDILGRNGVWSSEFEFLEKENISEIVLNITNSNPLSSVNELIFSKYAYEILKTFSFILNSLNIKGGKVLINEDNEKGIRLLNEYKEFFKNIIIKEIKEEYPMFDRDILLKREFENNSQKISILSSELLFYSYEALFKENPFTKKFIVISGEKKRSFFTRVPLGIKIKDVLKNLQINIGVNEKILINGIMTGYIGDKDLCIGKKINSISLIESDKKIITSRISNTYKELKRQCSSVCNSCNLCSEFCPKNRSGANVNPKKIIESIVSGENLINLINVFFCNECNLCSLYICPQNLNPMGLIKILKNEFKEQKIEKNLCKSINVEKEKISEIPKFKITNKHLQIKLGMNNFICSEDKEFVDNTKVFLIKIEEEIKTKYLKKLSFIKKEGDNIRKNEVIFKIPINKRDINYHSPIDGKVLEVSNKFILIIKE